MGLEKPKLWSHMREIDEREERRLAKEKQAGLQEGGAEVGEIEEELTEEDRRFMEVDKMLLGKLPVQVEHKLDD